MTNDKFEYVGKDNYHKSRRSRKEIAIELRGIPVVLLDYDTGEYIDEYRCVNDLATDMDVWASSINSRLQNRLMCCIPKHKLCVMYKEKYDLFLKLNQK